MKCRSNCHSAALNGRICDTKTAGLSTHQDIKLMYIDIDNNPLVIVIRKQKVLTNLRSVMIASNSIPFRHIGLEESETSASR